MDTYIDQIRAALADDASDDAHQAGATACRAILAAIDGKRAARGLEPAPPTRDETPSSPVATPTAAAPTKPRTLGELPALLAVRAATREQILDHVIARLKALQPEVQAGASVVSMIGAFRNLSLDQVLDLGIAKLQTALAPRAAPTPVLPEGTRVIHLAPVERPRRVP
jgi:hypothetical protein